MATKKFRCKVCGYIHEGDKAPEKCPVCQAPASEFEEITDSGAKVKKGMNTNGNGYTLIYMAVMIVIVSLLLSITSGLLKERQDKNVKLDTMRQILSSMPAVETELESADAEELYNKYITDFVVLNEAGETVKTLDKNKNFGYKPEKDADEYLLYTANVNGETKYIIPLNGVGLWGAIWGYIALDSDRNTVNGVFFAHASETPGLGANIVTPAFRNPFKGKHILNNGEFVSLLVAKKGEKSQTQESVDALSGGTITSKGVESMLKTCLEKYSAFFSAANTTPAAVAAAAVESAAENEANVEPKEEGEN